MARKWEVAEDGRPFVWANTKAVKSGKCRRYGKLINCAVCGVEAFSCHTSIGIYCSHSCSSHGENHSYWKGGRSVESTRIRMWVEGRGRVEEHRLVVETETGKALRTNQHVHHIDGNPHNNDIKNLLVCSSGMHRAIHNHKEWRS
jgi:hypothetical protein